MDALPASDKNVRNWCMFCHLSALVGLFIPGGNIIGPIVIWLMKRDQISAVNEHGKESINFQISVFIYVVALSVACFILMFIVIGFLLIPVIALVCLADIILVIIAALKANEGQLYRYPLALRLIK